MTVQVIRDTSFGGNLGEALGTGLGHLAKHKLNQITQKHEREQYAKDLEPTFGQDTANFLSTLNPKERESALYNLKELLQLNQQPNQQQNGLGTLSQQPEQNQQQPQEQISPERAQLLQDIFTSPHDKREREKLDLQKQKITAQQQKDIREFSGPYRENAKKAEASIRDYQQLLKDARSGELRSGNTYQLLKKLGWEDFGRNTTTELAEKVIARLGQNIAGKFGKNARLTNFLEQTFQRSLPTLKNTPEGIQVIAVANMAAEESEIVRNDIRKEVIKKHGLTDQTEDMIDKLAEPIISKIDQDAAAYAESIIGNKGTQDKFEELPPAKYHKGDKIVHEETGRTFVSDGKEWVEK